MVRIENHCQMLEITFKVAFLRFFKAILALCPLNSFKLAFFGVKFFTQHYLQYIIVLKWLNLKQ